MAWRKQSSARKTLEARSSRTIRARNSSCFIVRHVESPQVEGCCQYRTSASHALSQMLHVIIEFVTPLAASRMACRQNRSILAGTSASRAGTMRESSTLVASAGRASGGSSAFQIMTRLASSQGSAIAVDVRRDNFPTGRALLGTGSDLSARTGPWPYVLIRFPTRPRGSASSWTSRRSGCRGALRRDEYHEGIDLGR